MNHRLRRVNWFAFIIESLKRKGATVAPIAIR